MTPKLKKIIITIVVLVALFIVYAVFIKGNPEGQVLIDGTQGTEGSSQDAQILGSQISQALLRIEQIKLDRSIFENQIYRSLVDRSRPILDEPMGRPNPFAPLGSVVINLSSTATKSATSTATSTTSQNNN